MARPTGLFQRGGVWWLRVMVPMDLQQALGGRTKIVRSLNTYDRKVAIRLALQRRTALVVAFDSGQLDLVRELDSVCGSDAPCQPQHPAPSSSLPASVPTFSSTSPNTPLQTESSIGGLAVPRRTLRDAYDKWSVMSEGGTDAKRACGRALALYEQCAGSNLPDIRAITRAQGHEFKAWLLGKARAGKYASKTIHSYLVSVCGLLRFAHQELEWTERHCWLGITIEYETERPRTRWSAAHLETMAGLPLFKKMQVPTGWQSGGLAAYWLPLLGLYTGGTVSELAQLKIVDVVDEGKDGLWLRITDTGEGQGLKTTQRRRMIPVHSELIRLGFGDYVAAIRKSGSDSVWPELRLHPTKPGTYFSNWWGSFRRAPDATELLPDFHSMRHTARSTMADSGLDAAALDVITGHGKKGSAGVRTYTHFSPATLRAAIEGIRYAALATVPRVYRAEG